MQDVNIPQSQIREELLAQKNAKFQLKRNPELGDGKYSLTINFDADEIDKYLGTLTAQKLREQPKDSDDNDSISIKSFGELSDGVNLTTLLDKMNRVDLTNEEFKEIAKALIATTTREKRRAEIEAGIREELQKCSVGDPDCVTTMEVYMTPQQTQDYKDGKPVVITKDTYDMYYAALKEIYGSEQAKNAVQSLNKIPSRDIEERVVRRIGSLKSTGKDELWDEMFEEYKKKANVTDEDLWNEVGHQYSRTHPVDAKTKKQMKDAGVEVEEELPFKTIGELMDDYFKLDQGQMCSLDTEVPKYFYYKGQTFEIDFKALDLVHDRVLKAKQEKENYEVGEAVALFHEMGLEHFNPTEEDLQRIRMLKTMEEQL